MVLKFAACDFGWSSMTLKGACMAYDHGVVLSVSNSSRWVAKGARAFHSIKCMEACGNESQGTFLPNAFAEVNINGLVVC